MRKATSTPLPPSRIAATLAGEVIKFKEAIRYREDALAHLDASLRILDRAYRSDTVPPKMLRHVKLFGGGE